MKRKESVMRRFQTGLTAAAVLGWLLVFSPDLHAAKANPVKVDINSATQQELEALPGVGAATAKKIIAGRPYASVADLSKAGLSAKTIEKITPLVTAGAASAKPAAAAAATEKAATMEKPATKAKAPAPALSGAKVDLNSASEKELEALPGVGPATAKKIIAGRPYSSAADLAKAGVPAKTIETITPLVTAGGKAAASVPEASAPPAAKPAPASAASKPATSGAMASAPAQPPPAKGMVWVNTETKVFHREGDKWYGNTKHGKYMTEADAVKAGYRESKQKSSN